MSRAEIDRRAGRRNVALLAALFFTPAVAAAWLYFASAWRPAARAQHGELLEPPRPLPEIALTLPDGGGAPPGALRGYWHLVYLGDGPCDADCVRSLAELAAVRLALNQDAGRVRRVLLHAGDCCAPDLAVRAGTDLIVLGAAGPDGAAFLALFPRLPGGGIYVVDPLGNLILRYAAADASPGLLKDLKRLLRLSRVG